MKKLIIISFALLAMSSAHAQGCLPEGITFSTQVQIDSFQINYPGCTEIEGDVSINGTDITNLNGLSVLTSIGGDFTIGVYPSGENISLESLSGLENLTSIGGSLNIDNNPLLKDITSLSGLTYIGSGLNIGSLTWKSLPVGNPSLVSLTGLEGLTSLAGLRIIGNDSITDLTGLNNLNSIGGTLFISGNNSLTSLLALSGLTFIGGNFQIGHYAMYGPVGNPLLTKITGLEGLTSIGGDLIFIGSSLINLEGLSNLATIGGSLWMQDNFAITSLSGLDNLTSVNGRLLLSPFPGTGGEEFVPYGNPNIQSLEGLQNLTSIGGDLVIGQTSYLASLAGLENTTSIGGNLYIYANSVLTSLTGLDNVNAASIENLEIYFNDSLFACDVQSICDYLSSPNGTIEIHDNASGCDSFQEVEEACLGTGISTVSGQRSAVSLYPNPVFSRSNIKYQISESRSVVLKIVDIFGSEVCTLVNEDQASGEYTVPFDASGLPAGIYLLRLEAGEVSVTTKMIVLK